MPNHVANKFTATGSKQDLEKLFDIFSNEGEVTFNKVIPMPKELDISACSSADLAILIMTKHRYENISSLNTSRLSEWCAKNGVRVIKDLLKVIDSVPESFGIDMELGRKQLLNIANYGCRTWYEWRPDHWGTKWDAYDSVIKLENDRVTAEFNTAWNPPIPVLEKLHEIFPTLNIENKFLCEGFCVVGSFVNGVTDYIQETPDQEEFAKTEFGWEPYDEEE